jgi:hypothetical protein
MDGVPLGIAKQTFFTFDEVKAGRGQKNTNEPGINKNFPINKKASYRWLDHLQSLNKLVCKHNTSIIHVADREADIYEFLHLSATEASSFVVRSNNDRLTQGVTRREKTPTLTKLNSNASPLLTVTFTVDGVEIKCEIRHLTTTLRPPQRLPTAQSGTLKPIEVSVVDVQQIECNHDPVHWRLLTNSPCSSVEEILEVAKIYRRRWAIECFHRILKPGFQVEEVRLANRQRIENLATVLSIVSWFVFWLYKFGRSSPGTFAASVIDKDGIKVLIVSAKKLKIKVCL